MDRCELWRDKWIDVCESFVMAIEKIRRRAESIRDPGDGAVFVITCRREKSNEIPIRDRPFFRDTTRNCRPTIP